MQRGWIYDKIVSYLKKGSVLKLKIKKIEPRFSGSNSYIIYDENSGDGVMIDPSTDGETLLNAAKGISIKYIILTHAHFDHIGALEAVAEETGAPVVIHEDEAPSLIDTSYNLCLLAGEKENKKAADITVADGDEMTVGDIKLRFVHTPGHTKGSMCIFAGDKDLITGDTLFRGCIGRTDLKGGNSNDILKSVNELAKLCDDITIYPGHGEVSTIGFEKMTNPYIL